MANSGGFCTQAIFGREIWTGPGATIGPEILGRTFFHQVSGERCPTIRQNVPWLSVSPAAGTVPADGSIPLEVTVDAADLALGTHHATLLVTTTDPGAPELRVPVVVTVVDAAVADEDILG